MHVPTGNVGDIDVVLDTINGLGCGEMWQGAVVRWTTLRSRSTDRSGDRISDLVSSAVFWRGIVSAR